MPGLAAKSSMEAGNPIDNKFVGGFPQSSRNRPSDIVLNKGLKSGYFEIQRVGDTYSQVLYLCCGKVKSLNNKYIRLRIKHQPHVLTCQNCTQREVRSSRVRLVRDPVVLECNGHRWTSLNWENTPRTRDKPTY